MNIINLKRLLAIGAVIGALLAPAHQAGAGNAPALFQSEQQAQQHCPTDTVVWLNLPTGVYHFQGQRWYGNTKAGAYVCQKEADASGDRATRNGQ